MIAIGLNGKIGAGKDSIANVLVRDYGFVKVRFADALKEEVLTRLPRTVEAIARLNRDVMAPGTFSFYEHERERWLRYLLWDRKPAGIRELLQEYGTEVRRGDDPDYWVNAWLQSAGRFHKVVAPDLRFPNEYRAIVGQDSGHVWQVHRPGKYVDSHQSEQMAEDPTVSWGMRFENSGDLDDLENLVHLACAAVGLPRHLPQGSRGVLDSA